ncbi:MAG TPA: hypothetical protein VIJ94_12320 [Caulobacteraceae bacterium]
MTLDDEIAAYEAQRTELEASHLGQWAVIHDRELAGAFDDFQAAAMEAVRRFGRGPYLIRQIGAPLATLPASVVYGLQHEPGQVRI